jgi:putative inorganic carbon (hco3(-)) transporter
MEAAFPTPAAAPRWWQPRSVAAPAPAGKESFAFRALIAFLVFLILAPQNLVPALGSLRPALLAGGLAVAACLAGRFSRGERLSRPSRELKVAAALGAWAIATIPLSYWPGGSLAVLLDLYLKALALFWLLSNLIDTPGRLRRVVAALTLLGVPLAVTGMRNYASGAFIDDGAAGVPRIAGYNSGVAGNPNDLALMLNLLLPLAVGLALGSKDGKARVVALLAAGILAAGVVVTFSRAGFLTLAVTLAVLGVQCLRRGQWAPVAGAALLALLALPLLPEGYVSRIASITQVESDPTGSAQARWADNWAALRVIAAQPFLGTGLGTGILALNQERGAAWTAVHNVYLEHGVELGVPGLGLFLALLIGAWRSAHGAGRAAERAGDPALGHLAAGIGVALIAFAVSGFFHPVAYHFYFYLVAGLAAAAGSLPAATKAHA